MRRTFFVWALLLLAYGALDAAQIPAAAPAGTLTIYLARHGQTDWNLEGRTQGSTDIPLNATGRQQAARLKEYLKGVQIDAVYSSTLGRSVETADIVHGTLPWTKLAELGERKFGKFEGHLANDPETAQDFRRRRWLPDDSLDGGESVNALAERVRSAISKIRNDHPSGTILVVGHSAMNQMFLGVLLSMTIQQMQGVNQGNDELFVIAVPPGTSPQLVSKDRY